MLAPDIGVHQIVRIGLFIHSLEMSHFFRSRNLKACGQSVASWASDAQYTSNLKVLLKANMIFAQQSAW